MASLDICSLEEDDCSQLFITQESKEGGGNENMEVDDEFDLFLGVKSDDFASPMASIVESRKIEGAQYSDISEDDFEDWGQGKAKDARLVFKFIIGMLYWLLLIRLLYYFLLMAVL